MARDMVQVQRGGGQSFAAPTVSIGRSQFNRSHGLKTSFDASYLYPIFVDDVLPGDTLTMKLHGFARIFSPLDAPVMDNIELETFFFFVPNRIVWENWVDFQGEHVGAGAQDTDFTVPIMADGLTVNHDGGTAAEDLLAHFGIPDGLQTTMVPISCLPLRGYNMIYREWFRDQNLVGQQSIEIGNGPDASSEYIIHRSNKKHDYFTSALPYLQKGDPITVALLGAAPVQPVLLGTSTPQFRSTTGSKAGGQFVAGETADQTVVDMTSPTGSWVAGDTMHWDTVTGLEADMSSVGGVSINALREAVAIQRLLETDARGGTRYVESIKAHFGVTSPDFRLQRPEFLGGEKAMINISPVANTSDTAGADQAELRGIGTGVISGHGWAKSFTEHGYVIGLVRARADLTYFQGLDRHWSKSTRYDFFIPALANLGEQAILNKELFVSNVVLTDNGVFGYQERWAEYRMKQSKITSIMNPDAAANIAFWHLAEDFSSLPALNSTFMVDRTPMDRITTVDTAQHFILDLWFDYKCARPIPVKSIPSLTARF